MDAALAKLTGSVRSKTMLFSLLLSILGAVQVAMEFFNSVLTPKMYGLVMLAIGVTIAVLRWVTSQPLDQK